MSKREELERIAKAMRRAIALRIEDADLRETAFKTTSGILEACNFVLIECEKAEVPNPIAHNIVAAALEAASLGWWMNLELYPERG